MKANIPKEQELAIYDYIYLTLMIEILEGKALKGMNVEQPIKTILNELVNVKAYLRNNHIKVHEVKPDPDHQFVSYPYSIKVNGGYRQGDMRFWRFALTYQLREKLKQLQRKEKFVESEFD